MNIINNDEIERYDVCILYEKNIVSLKFTDVEDPAVLIKFANSKEWLLPTEFPTPAEIHHYLEKAHNKPENWFNENYMAFVLDACDKVCMKQHGKVFVEIFGKDETTLMGIRVLLWLLFVHKELKCERLPKVYTYVAPREA